MLIQIGCIRGQSQSFPLEVRKLLQAVGGLMNSWVGVVQRIHRGYDVDGICPLDVLNSPCKLAESTSPFASQNRIDINLRRVFTQTH